ncbi:MAG: hypothetical protein K2I25_08220, partial [Muribaculaceae bacterium]|nr:hypothetical protein [Muribaculaceae bacterium]
HIGRVGVSLSRRHTCPTFCHIVYKCKICVIYSKIFLFEGLKQFFQKLAQMFYPIFVIIATFAIESLT